MLANTSKMLLNIAHYQRGEIEKRIKTICNMWLDGNISTEDFDKDYITLRQKKELVNKEIEFFQKELDLKTETEKEEEEETEENYV